MNLARSSVHRPIFTTMVTLIVVVLGAVSLSRLRIDLLPSIELPTLTVRTEYEGASPEVIEQLVTQIIEEIVGTVPGVKEMTSVSSEGNSSVRVTFVWGTDLDVAAQDVQARLEEEISELPDGIVRPRVSKFDIASFPVVIVGISSDLDPIELTEIIDKQVRQRFARVPGVAQADLWGGYAREVRIELDPVRLRALNLPLDLVESAIRDANLDLPMGTIEQGRYEVTLRAPSGYVDLDQIRDTVVAIRSGAVVTVDQFAKVVDTHERLRRIVRVNGTPGLRIGIRKQADANTVEVSRNILDEIARVNEEYPQIEVVAVVNQGNFIERSISNVAQSVLYGGGLAILVLLFFLRNLRSTFVISLAIPISIVATFALIHAGGFTLNLMTLGGLALGVGMMVDSSIVVLENIFRRYREHEDPVGVAAVAGASEVSTAIVASTITTLVTFLPLIFVRGVSGLLFKELAYVIAFSLVCALLVALTLVPMLASKLLRPLSDSRGPFTALAATTERAFLALEELYRDLLRFVLRQRVLAVLLAVSALAASLLLVPFIGTEFIPPSDEGEVRVTGEMEVGTRLGLVDRQTQLIESIVVDAVPEAVSWVTSVGASGQNRGQTAQGEIQLTLNSARDRNRSNADVATDLRKKLDAKIPGMTIRTRAPQGQFLLERVLGGDEGLTIEIRGFDLETLNLIAANVAQAIADVGGITDVDDGVEPGVPQEILELDRDRAADLGISVRQVVSALETAVAGSRAGDFRSQGNSYRILVQMADASQLTIDEILDMTITSPLGEPVALRNVVRVNPGRGPVVINRKDQQRVVSVKANVAGRDLGSVAAEVEARLDGIARPIGYDLKVAGSFEEQQESFRELLVSIILALVLVYMVLACQYESLVDPLVVMLSVPLAGIGVLVTLFLTETTFNVQSFIGCIMLGGIVVNNAILLVDQAGRLRRQDGLSTMEAVAEAGRRRLRPILMTTLTTILGLIPLALGIGEGTDAQAPLARAVVGGLTASTLITLVLIPAVYSLVHPDR
ncbi:MAG: efflux RND transporter permease subunit [Planctomycetes bacterium]|nr:efflux RND transporter permease subunit [Planctomycetota bacterium]